MRGREGRADKRRGRVQEYYLYSACVIHHCSPGNLPKANRERRSSGDYEGAMAASEEGSSRIRSSEKRTHLPQSDQKLRTG